MKNTKMLSLLCGGLPLSLLAYCIFWYFAFLSAVMVIALNDNLIKGVLYGMLGVID